MGVSEQALRLEALEKPSPPAWRRWVAGGISFARRKPLGAFGATILILTIVVAVFSPWIARYPYGEPHFSDTLQAPNSTYWFGTDILGKDFFSRMVIGSQVTVLAGLGTVVVAAFLSVLVGGVSGYFGGLTTKAPLRQLSGSGCPTPDVSLISAPSLLSSLGQRVAC